MLNQILVHTPIWVFALLAALIALGLAQMRSREVSLQRASILPLVMAALSLAGTLSAFGTSAGPLAAWAAALAVSTFAALSLPQPDGVAYNATTQRFTLPGSAVPLALMMGIFVTKYAVGASLGMHLNFAQAPSFALTASAVYGLFSGAFLGRGIRLWRLSRDSQRAWAAA
jgi:hypothetical protein